ncbi:CsbD family protein [Actinocorallia sp. A-T 12471]|uniref:CsbD family protein n=1 Tax=Actinocorallia sp. A-T 12471 TaxID=3089813 RepID=UPI0029D3BD86|nr:CsbD family protein [Actinocorallia sp. A-T 12471]MDX6741713.1 CsbD family protein [Actinocorallia sp. A-T 12471]
MGFLDKMKNRAEQMKGRAKEAVGRDNRDRSMEAEGRADRLKGSAKQAGEHMKDAVRDIRHRGK